MITEQEIHEMAEMEFPLKPHDYFKGENRKLEYIKHCRNIEQKRRSFFKGAEWVLSHQKAARMDIIDIMTDYVNGKDRETIPRKDIGIIALKIYLALFK